MTQRDQQDIRRSRSLPPGVCARPEALPRARICMHAFQIPRIPRCLKFDLAPAPLMFAATRDSMTDWHRRVNIHVVPRYGIIARSPFLILRFALRNTARDLSIASIATLYLVLVFFYCTRRLLLRRE